MAFDALMDKWNKEAVITFDQMKSNLVGSTTERQLKGRTYHSVLFENAEATTGKARHQQVTLTQQNHTDITVTLQPRYIAYMIDDWDQAMTDINFRSTLTEQASGAIWRAYDQCIIDALGATSNSETILTANANTLNYAAAAQMAAVLGSVRVPRMNRYGAISPAAARDLLTDTNYVNNFHATNNAVKSGVLTNVAGFDLMETDLLPNGAAGSTERRCFFWHKSAIHSVIAQPFRLSAQYENLYQGWSLVASIVMACVIVNPTGVHFADITTP